MISKHLSIPIFLCAFFLFCFSARAQNIDKNTLSYPAPGAVQILTATDGSTNIGRITSIGDDAIVFETELGAMTIPIEKIKSIQTVSATSIKQGYYWFPNPNRTRLYFAPTGRMIEKGSGYFADYYLFFPTVNFGLTDNFSIGGGCSILPTNSLSKQVYFLTPKVGLKQTEKFNLAAGALVMKFPDFDDEDTPLVSVLYGVGTYGSADRSVTFGFGYGMVDTDFADKPMIVLGGEQRLSRRIAFVTENWILPGTDNVLISYGLRFFGEKLSVDLALLNVAGSDAIFPGIPYLDFVYNFR